MVDAVDLLLLEKPRELRVERLRRFLIVAERLLHDAARPARAFRQIRAIIILWAARRGQTAAVQIFKNLIIELRRHRKIKKLVRADAPARVDFPKLRRERYIIGAVIKRQL